MDVLVITPFPVAMGAVVPCRAIGVLKMDDEAGGDAKLLAVPIDKVLPIYKHWRKPEDIAPERLHQIQHFFEHYKDLERVSGSRCRAGRDRSRLRKKLQTAQSATKRLLLPSLAPAFIPTQPPS